MLIWQRRAGLPKEGHYVMLTAQTFHPHQLYLFFTDHADFNHLIDRWRDTEMGSLEFLAAVGGSVCCHRAACGAWNTLKVSPTTECGRAKPSNALMLKQCSQSLLASATNRTRDGVEGPAPGCMQPGSPAPMALSHWFQHNPSVSLNFGAFPCLGTGRWVGLCQGAGLGPVSPCR